VITDQVSPPRGRDGHSEYGQQGRSRTYCRRGYADVMPSLRLYAALLSWRANGDRSRHQATGGNATSESRAITTGGFKAD